MAIEVLAVVAILDFAEHLKMDKMAFWVIDFSPWGRNLAPFALRSTVSDTMAIEVSTLVAILDFSKHLKMSKMGLGHLHMPSGSKSSSVSLYDRRFSRYGQSKFQASDNRGFSWRTSQTGQNGFLGICIFPWGRNRAPFRSTNDGFRDNGKWNFGQMATVQNLEIRKFRA